MNSLWPLLVGMIVSIPVMWGPIRRATDEASPFYFLVAFVLGLVTQFIVATLLTDIFRNWP